MSLRMPLHGEAAEVVGGDTGKCCVVPLDYTVRLEMFEGPLDLLLYLIRRAEVEIADIPIAQITEQYLKFIEQFEIEAPSAASSVADSGAASVNRSSRRPLDIERAGEFLVMAATLMEIKSRMLTPVVAAHASGDTEAGSDSGEGGSTSGARPRGPAGAPIDPRAELVRQLLEYKRFRDATQRLEEYRDEFFAQFPTAAAPLMEAKPDATTAGVATGLNGDVVDADHDGHALVDLEDTSIVDLVEAFARIMQTVDFSRVGEHRVVFDDTPIELHAEDILLRLRERLTVESPSDSLRTAATDGLQSGEMEFASIFKGRTRSEAIGLFLALLELVKQQKVSVRQEEVAASGEPEQGEASLPARGAPRTRIVLALIESPAHPQVDAEAVARASRETAAAGQGLDAAPHAESGSTPTHAL